MYTMNIVGFYDELHVMFLVCKLLSWMNKCESLYYSLIWLHLSSCLGSWIGLVLHVRMNQLEVEIKASIRNGESRQKLTDSGSHWGKFSGFLRHRHFTLTLVAGAERKVRTGALSLFFCVFLLSIFNFSFSCNHAWSGAVWWDPLVLGDSPEFVWWWTWSSHGLQIRSVISARAPETERNELAEISSRTWCKTLQRSLTRENQGRFLSRSSAILLERYEDHVESVRVWLWVGAKLTNGEEETVARDPTQRFVMWRVFTTHWVMLQNYYSSDEMLFICRFALRLDVVLFLHFLFAFVLFFLVFPVVVNLECFIAYRPHFHNSDDFKKKC